MVRELPARLTKSTVVVVCCVVLAACGADRQETTTGNRDNAVSAAGGRLTTIDQPVPSQPVPSQTGTSRTVPSQTGTSTVGQNQITGDPETAITNSQTTVAEPTTALAGTEPVPSDPSPESATSVSTTPVPDTTVATIPPVEVVTTGGASAIDRVPAGQNWAPFATFAEVTLVHPSNRIERIGFHESNHDGARQLEPTAQAVSPITLDSRSRGTGSRTAADIVVEPGTEIRAPVTGTVIRAGGYVLYCDHQDDFLVIEPDAHPGWEVKLLHINGVMVSAGDRVEAGVTVVAPQATVLPFDSQVDEFTNTPPWPHVHIELVDPSIPDRPSTGGGC